MSRFWILALAFSLTACAAEPTMDLSSFDRSCSAPEECTLVFAHVCGCSCDEVAVRAGESARYNAELFDRREDCEQITCPPCEDDAHEAVCQAQVCTVK